MTSVGETSNSDDRIRVYRIVAGRRISFDREGFLWDADDWDEGLASALACERGLETLTERHWRVLHFFRQFYSSNGRAPLNRQLREATGLSLLTLESLFPGGIKYGARRIAGLPNPKHCG